MSTCSTRLKVKVVPGASKSEITGWLGKELKVRVSAPPERGKANSAVESIIADALQLPSEFVKIVAGKSAARKTVEVQGLTGVELRNRLNPKDI